MKRSMLNPLGFLTLDLVDQRPPSFSINSEEMEEAFRAHSHARQLLDYGSGQDVNMKRMKEGVEKEDALRLMNLICGGYPLQDFGSYLSYNQFQQKKQEFDVLGDLYRDVQCKYRSHRVEESDIEFRSLLLMVYLQENISKLSRVKIQEIFAKNRIVW